MTTVPVSNAPEVFSAPLISAEKSPLFEKIVSAVSQALMWFRSLFAFVFPIKEKEVTPQPKQDVFLAQRALQAAKQARPSPIRFLKTSISQGIFPFAISWYQGTHYAFSAFIAKRVVDATSAGVVFIANAFFPAYSDAVKQVIALSICAPAVWIAANDLGYRQGYFFFFGIGVNVLNLARTVYSHYQTRKHREAHKAAIAQAKL